MYEHRRPHPYADQFGPYWAWRFEDGLEALARASADAAQLRQWIFTVHDTLALAHDGWDVLARPWRAFVARKVAARRALGPAPVVPDPAAALGGPASDWPTFNLMSPQNPFIRDVRSRIPEDLPKEADLVTPPGWEINQIGRWDVFDEVEVIYDPLRHEIEFTRTTAQEWHADLEATGWKPAAADRHYVMWTRDLPDATGTTPVGHDEPTSPADQDPDGPEEPGPAATQARVERALHRPRAESRINFDFRGLER